MTDAERILLLAIPFFVLAMVVEGIALARGARGRPYELRDTAASLSMGLGYLGIATVWKVVDLRVLGSFSAAGLVDWGDGAIAWLVVIVGWDFLYYWYHRAGHEIRLLWAAHVNHHSSRRYNLSTALRQTWTPFASVLFFVPLAALGFTPEQILAAGALNLLYQFWIHTETIDRLGPLERVLNTPSHHRVHHGANERYLDRNYGGILIVWDRMFGTFEAEAEPPVYGLTKNVEGYNPLWIAFHEYVAIARDFTLARRWRDRLAFVLRAPGWRPV
jgi:sterol desaturase/sphingolipid hydroxylase (fatty acid hydroxylase superfamily)